MDPVTLALLISGGLAAGQGIAGSFQNNTAQKHNREELDDLLDREKRGALGLTPGQQQQAENALLSPVQRGAEQMQSRQEQVMAANPSTSGAALSRLRTETGRTVAGAQQDAAAQLLAANNAAIQQQRNEIESRMAAKAAYNRDDVNGILGGIAQLAGPLGMAAGAPPGTSTFSGNVGGGGGAAPSLSTAQLDRKLGEDPLMRAPMGAADSWQEALARRGVTNLPAMADAAASRQTVPGLSPTETQQLRDYYAAHPDRMPPGLEALFAAPAGG